MQRTRELIEQGITLGLHLGAQVVASIDGAEAMNLAIGESRPGVAMTPETLVLWLSTSKPIGGMAILMLVERGQLALDEPVATYIPEFAAAGKEAVTLRHLLTHVGGFRWVDLERGVSGWEEIIRRICAAPLERGWVPGEKAGYHPATSWYVLAEVIARVDGRSFSRFVREEIFLPLGMNDSWIGMPEEQLKAYGERIAILPEMDKPNRPPYRHSTPQGIVHAAPGAGGYGPASELARFYEMLRLGGELAGKRLLSSEMARRMTSRQREGMFDETFRHTMDWGLGIMMNSAHHGSETIPYNFGPYASSESFGHGGARSSIAFVDPPRKLVVVAMMNGAPTEAQHHRRMRPLIAAIYEDLGVV